MSDQIIEGLWTAEFGVPSHTAYGAGVLVFLKGAIYGGDSTYYYVGEYDLQGDTISAQLNIKHYFGPKNNVLGPGIDQARLKVKGKFDAEKFVVSNGEFMAVLTKRQTF